MSLGVPPPSSLHSIRSILRMTFKMMMLQLFRRLAVATVLSSTLLHTCNAAKATTNTLTANEHFTAQVNWLTSPENNGYFSSKITYNNGAMYVTEHVAKDEVLMFIPSKILFSGSYENQINKKDEGFKTRGFCATGSSHDQLDF